MNLVLWGVVIVVTIGLVLGLRHTREEELSHWQRATRQLNKMCPPADETATLWCKVVAGSDETPEPLSLAKPAEPRVPVVSPAPESPHESRSDITAA